jgi:hypothetical protein
MGRAIWLGLLKKGNRMIRNLKVLGVAVVAVLAMSAVIASAASATNFTASKYPTAATATSPLGNDDFKTEAGSVECAGHFAVAALSEPSETVQVTPTYTSCRAFGFLSATVTMDECVYIFHSNGTADVECPAGNEVTIVSSTCEVRIPTQTGLSSVVLQNALASISAQANITGITYTVTKDGFGCPFSGTGTKKGATYTQNEAITVSSTNGATIDIG